MSEFRWIQSTLLDPLEKSRHYMNGNPPVEKSKRYLLKILNFGPPYRRPSLTQHFPYAAVAARRAKRALCVRRVIGNIPNGHSRGGGSNPPPSRPPCPSPRNPPPNPPTLSPLLTS